MKKAAEIRDRIENAIESISDDTEREVLSQKYLCFRTNEETAEIMSYSKRQIERIHIKALSHLNIY